MTSALRSPASGPHLVALDVDGTLVDHDGAMSARVRRAVQAVVAAGHHVVIATGRSRAAALPVVELAGITRGYAVASNGGITLRIDAEAPGGYAVIDAAEFRPEPALRTLREAVPGARFALETAEGAFWSTVPVHDASFGAPARVVGFEELASMSAVRVVVFSEELDLEAFTEAIERAGLHGVAYAVGWTPWLDVTAHGVSKASALEQNRSRLGIPRERTVAVGDGFNDVEMLTWAGRGVAMGQAAQGVRAVADEVAPSVYEDGAAVVLESLLD